MGELLSKRTRTSMWAPLGVCTMAFPGSDGSKGARAADIPLVTSKVNGRDDIYDSLRVFFGAGR